MLVLSYPSSFGGPMIVGDVEASIRCEGNVVGRLDLEVFVRLLVAKFCGFDICFE